MNTGMFTTKSDWKLDFKDFAIQFLLWLEVIQFQKSHTRLNKASFGKLRIPKEALLRKNYACAVKASRLFVSRTAEKHHRPLFPQKEVDAAGAGSQTLADVLFRNAQKGKAKYGHPLSHDYPLGAEICGQDRYADPECCGQSGLAQKEQLSAGLSFGR